MDRSFPDDSLSEALHLNAQANLLDQRAKELDRMVAYVSEWLEIFQADAEFANQRIQEFRESVANCENLTSRARNVMTALAAKDSVTFQMFLILVIPLAFPRLVGFRTSSLIKRWWRSCVTCLAA